MPWSDVIGGPLGVQTLILGTVYLAILYNSLRLCEYMLLGYRGYSLYYYYRIL
jgi:hypothetical protein